MSRKVSVKDYPEHLNPFDDNYSEQVLGTMRPGNSRQKYNTWGASRPNQLSPVSSSKPKPSLLEKPWRALHISPKSKIVRNLSFLKTAVERFTSKKKRLSHSSSYTEGGGLPPRSHSVHDDLTFRIISPKLKEKIRQQAFSKNINNQIQTETDSTETPSSPQLNGRLASSPSKPEVLEPLQIIEDSTPTSPEPREKFNLLGARPKTRKKRPPPPPPTDRSRTTNLEIVNGPEKAEDSHSINSSITQDLEKDASSEDDISSTELNNHILKSNQKKY